MSTPHALRRILAGLRLDATMAIRHLVLNVIAGSAFVPRPARWLIYRAAGLDVRTLNVFSGTRITGGNLSIGKGTFINHGAYLDAAAGRIEIGERCHLGPQVTILTATHDLDASGAASQESHFTTTSIGDRVWIGARALVLPGARIESRCVIAAGAVVTGHCESGGVYGGVPARWIKATV